MALYDPKGEYSKYTGVTIYSILENTKKDVSIHLLHDSTLNNENKEKFFELVSSYGQTIYFYSIEMDKKLLQLKSLKTITIGALFRVMMSKVLLSNIEKLIYLDSDIIVNMDIEELWKQELNSNILLAKKDADGKRNMCDKGILDYETYINSGVMLLDFARICKEYDLYGEAISFFEKYPECDFADQDALNYIFKGKIGFLDEKYNFFTTLQCGKELKLDKCIYHFAGDYPHVDGTRIYDRLFLDILIKTPWGTSKQILDFYIKQIKEKNIHIQFIKKILKQEGKKKIFFGASGKLGKNIVNGLFINKEKDYCVDNNQKYWGTRVEGLIVYMPTRLLEEDKKKISIFVASKLYYKEIKEQLEAYGFIENEQFFDGRRLLTEDEGGYFIL